MCAALRFIVTGASDGIGGEVVRWFSSQKTGFDVLPAAQNQAKLVAVLGEIDAPRSFSSTPSLIIALLLVAIISFVRMFLGLLVFCSPRMRQDARRRARITNGIPNSGAYGLPNTLHC